MLSRRFSFQKVIGHHERRTNASTCHHFGQFSSSVGEPDREISVPKSNSEDSTSKSSSDKWGWFRPRQIFSRFTDYFRSSSPSANSREATTPDSYVVFVKGEESQNLGAKELESLLRSLGQNVTQAELQEIMKVANSTEGGSGKPMDFPLFLKNMVDKMEGSELEKELITIFKDIDKDGDGLISTVELRQALAEMGVKLSDAEFDEVVQDASDGHLDFTNFVKAMMAQSEFWQ